ncbi:MULTISPECIES: CsbD family protein [Agromyces]|uniref:CsbD family protein n=1 Tax=Agromyces soli TaxID=659012 RepID=A0ABY4AVK1_9MICO|nr:CsbD family protein [Agromyces soli]UOE27178.1 CsbD family protein [Agromyces soli]
MGLGDKAKHAAEELAGKAKQGIGKATGNEELEAEGRADEAKADLKQAGDKAKDAGNDVKDAFTGRD